MYLPPLPTGCCDGSVGSGTGIKNEGGDPGYKGGDAAKLSPAYLAMIAPFYQIPCTPPADMPSVVGTACSSLPEGEQSSVKSSTSAGKTTYYLDLNDGLIDPISAPLPVLMNVPTPGWISGVATACKQAGKAIQAYTLKHPGQPIPGNLLTQMETCAAPWGGA